MKRDPRFAVTSSLGKKIRTSSEYWQKIIETKHPTMVGREELVKQTLTAPEQIRRSAKDPTVHLYYRTDKIKAGEVI